MPGGLLVKRLEDAGFPARLVPVSVLDEIKVYFDRLDKSSPFFKRFPDLFHFTIPERLPGAASILIVAGRSPAVRVYFTLKDGVKTFILPPTYLNAGLRDRMQELVYGALDGTGYAVRAAVPLKLLSAMSGLSRYGKNNITYYPGLGSYVLLQAYFTPLPPAHEVGEPLVADECATCGVCIRACPTGAISDSHFVIDVGRCLTFYNEYPEPFPAWMSQDIHHCLIGCMRCQDACPKNAVNKAFVVDGPAFDADETAQILAIEPLESLSPAAVDKIDALSFKGDYYVFARNLNALVHA